MFSMYFLPACYKAVCQATPAPAKYCIRVRITGWWPRDIRKYALYTVTVTLYLISLEELIALLCFMLWNYRFLVHYEPDTYNHIESASTFRWPRTSGIFFVLKVQGEELVLI